MKAFQLVGHGSPGRFQLADIPAPVPAADEVVVEVHACGLNHLDLWCERGALPVPVSLPRTPGCEIAGRIVARGAQVSSWDLGTRVAVQSNLFCGACEYCRAGQESMCLGNVMLGVQRDGGLAEQVTVPARALVQLPANVDFNTSAALTLAGSTAMHMLTDRVTVQRGQWVLVMAGASGVGSAAIQIARELGARVLSTGSTPAKRELALRLGAEHALDPADPGWPAEVRRLTGKRGVDVVVEHLGGETLPRLFQCLARGGTVVTCGATTGAEVKLNLWPFFVKQQRLVGSYGRNSADLRATLDWAAAGRLQPVIDSTYGLAEAEAALARLRSRQVLGKVIVQPVRS
ncbi:MAG TPA: zinc-binding dehydrogenase [Methylomirabilota bacterium]|nr:zinc-binding dehydrogenase [Methylomirabilota bacterium]